MEPSDNSQHAADGVYPHCRTIRRTVHVGGLTKAEILQEFQRYSISMNVQGTKLFAEAVPDPPLTPYQLDTVELTASQLGYPAGATSADLFARACELGLSLCPLEAAPFLRLQFLDQAEGRWITIASEKPSIRPDFPNGFYLRRLADGLWLRGYTASDDYVFDADDRFIFSLRSS